MSDTEVKESSKKGGTGSKRPAEPESESKVNINLLLVHINLFQYYVIFLFYVKKYILLQDSSDEPMPKRACEGPEGLMKTAEKAGRVQLRTEHFIIQ